MKTTVNAMDTEESCRLCDETSDMMFSIFDKNDDGIQVLQVIKEVLPIIIYRTDPLSKQICESCMFNVNMLHKFKKTAQETAERQKENLMSTVYSGKKELPVTVKLFLACGDEVEEGRKDTSTATDELTVFCTNCKQGIVNGELELCTDLHKVIADSMKKNKVTSESSESSKLLRRRKVVPFYHELDDSLCSSLTEYTQNTEGSQCFDMPSDMESVESDEGAAATVKTRASKRRRIESDEEDENESNGSAVKPKAKKPNTEAAESEPVKEEEKEAEEKEAEEIVSETNFEELFEDEEEYRYQPLSLLQLTLNLINTINIPDYEPEEFVIERIYPQCYYCGKQFQNLKLLAIHEATHIDIEVGEKIDNPTPWHSSRDDADIRNKWLNYFDENGYGDEDIVIDTEEVVNTENLLIPVEDNKTGEGRTLTGNEKIELDGTQPMVKGVYLGDYTKEERKTFYQSMRIQGVNKKFCELCRYTFKDNWAIESHYFSSACHYTCRYCGMRFNKQRHKFTEHVEEHKTKEDKFSDKIYAASKLSNIVPKIIHPPKERPKKIVVTSHNPPPPEPPPANFQNGGGVGQSQYHSIRVRNLMERRSLQANLPDVRIKEEPVDNPKDAGAQAKTGNQAYFCRKCYKVFFKLDEFNVHSKNCDYNQFPQMRPNAAKNPTPFNSRNGEVSPAGRPMRNCAKDTGPYKDDVYLPDSVMREPPRGQLSQQQQQQSFVCFICNTPFPTIYSRNSHMRIHKGENANLPLPVYRPRQMPQNNHHQQNYRSPPPMQYNHHYNPVNVDVMIKQEPMDMPMEPMVEIHEPEPEPEPQPRTAFPESLGDGAVSITPITKNPRQKPAINPNVMKIVQNNPHLSIKRPERQPQMREPNHHMPAGGGGGGFANNHMPPINHHLNMMNVFPDPDKTYKCSSCWEAFANKSHLYFHKKNQCEGSRLPCPFCKKRFGTEAEYSSHIYYSHPE